MSLSPEGCYENCREVFSLNDEIYDALTKDDTSQVVMKVLDILRKTDNLPHLCSITKSEESSTISRKAGNEAFKKGIYQKALTLYNQALLFAPKNSREMKLAYSNRSALLHRLEAWEACYKDINTCFDMGCPSDIVDKLTKRKNDVEPKLPLENFKTNIVNNVAENCMNPTEMRQNNLIPSVSSSVKVITGPEHKIIASAYIKVGAIVASEKAYVSVTKIGYGLFSCHYCQKKELNLIPCDGCIHALFCNEVCKYKCMQEFHKYECKIMPLLQKVDELPHLAVKASLKFRASCKSWKEVIVASASLGSERIKTSSIQEIYDTYNKNSILCYNDDKLFVYGNTFNLSFKFAEILHHLNAQYPLFFPKKAHEKQQAMRALARIMVFSAIYNAPHCLFQAQNNLKLDTFNYGGENFGLFPFISKLKKSCTPNLIVANNNNKLVLIALRPINSGEELTVSYLCHKFEMQNNNPVHNIKSFLYYGKVCGCSFCKKDIKYEGELTKYQKKYYSKLNFREIDFKLEQIDIISVFNDLLKAMTVLKDVPNSKEFYEVFIRFRQCIFFFECVYSDNKILDNNLSE